MTTEGNAKVASKNPDLFEAIIVATWNMAEKRTAERCIEIVMETLSTPDGERYRDRSEVVHAILREHLSMGGV
jgi:hypothetical protein